MTAPKSSVSLALLNTEREELLKHVELLKVWSHGMHPVFDRYPEDLDINSPGL